MFPNITSAYVRRTCLMLSVDQLQRCCSVEPNRLFIGVQWVPFGDRRTAALKPDDQYWRWAKGQSKISRYCALQYYISFVGLPRTGNVSSPTVTTLTVSSVKLTVLLHDRRTLLNVRTVQSQKVFMKITWRNIAVYRLHDIFARLWHFLTTRLSIPNWSN